MDKLLIWGYGFGAANLYFECKKDNLFEIIGFADNSIDKIGNYVDGCPIYSLEQVVKMKKKICFKIVVASLSYAEIMSQLKEVGIDVDYLYLDGVLKYNDAMTFEKLLNKEKIYLYAGDICDEVHMSNMDLYGLSINKCDKRHIYHDITRRYPIPDNIVDGYQAEDVLEHIEYKKIVSVLDEIYRVLKPGAVCRISLPDYNSPRLKSISMYTENGDLLFDPYGGGNYVDGKVTGGGHVWFPKIDNVRAIIENTKFSNVRMYIYHDEMEILYREDFIPAEYGFVSRIENDIYSIVFDLIK